jgi:hypothetical protein
MRTDEELQGIADKALRLENEANGVWAGLTTEENERLERLFEAEGRVFVRRTTPYVTPPPWRTQPR